VNSISPASSIDLLEIYKSPAVNQISGFCSRTEQLDLNELIAAYHLVRESTPHRHEWNKRYFVGHSGVPSSGGYSNRREEHLAVALWNSSQAGRSFALPDGCTLIALRDADFSMGLEGQKPKLLRDCSLTNLSDLMS